MVEFKIEDEVRIKRIWGNVSPEDNRNNHGTHKDNHVLGKVLDIDKEKCLVEIYNSEEDSNEGGNMKLFYYKEDLEFIKSNINTYELW